MNGLHPTAVLCLWASTAVFVQTLPEPWLWLGGFVTAATAMLYSGARFGRLARRIRVLCGVTVLLFALATPGVRVFPGLTWLSLTWDGLMLGVAHATRLLAMVALVAVLLERLNVEQLISAIHHGLRGLKPVGLPIDRIAVRLSLVLDAMERTDAGWRAWLLDAEAPAPSGVASVMVQPMQWRDLTCIILALGFVIAWGLA